MQINAMGEYPQSSMEDANQKHYQKKRLTRLGAWLQK